MLYDEFSTLSSTNILVISSRELDVWLYGGLTSKMKSTTDVTKLMMHDITKQPVSAISVTLQPCQTSCKHITLCSKQQITKGHTPPPRLLSLLNVLFKKQNKICIAAQK